MFGNDDDDAVYISAGGLAHTTPQDAIDGSLAFEESTGTGSGCSQSSDNISDDNGGDDE